MATKDKLVDLEDLKALKDWIVGRIDMWNDITNTLTWSNATWVVFGYEKTTDSVAIQGVKVAKINVAAGEKYRITAWTSDYNYSSGSANAYGIPVVFTNSSDNLLSYNGPDACEDWTTSRRRYSETEVRVPSSAKYMYVLDYGANDMFNASGGLASAASGEVIVEKGI